MDKIVIDIETSNTFHDVGGHRNIEQLNVSLIGAYSYNQDKYLTFDEAEINEFEKLLKQSGMVIGFAINRFDIPVLNKHYPFDLFALSRLDLLDEIELSVGRRISLNILARVNLGLEKTHESGLEAIRLYNEGKLDELKEYCLQDVRLTKDLYELAQKQGYLIVPDRDTGEPLRAKLDFKEAELPATLF
jgi:hypothetical protein